MSNVKSIIRINGETYIFKDTQAITYANDMDLPAANQYTARKNVGLENVDNTSDADIIKSIYPVGSIYMSFNSTLPSAIAAIGTWQAVTGGYVLKTVTSGTGGTLSNAGNTGSTVLTIDQIPSHSHSYTHAIADGFKYGGGDYGNVRNAQESATTGSAGGGQGHTHTAGMPANVAIYMWKRTA